MKFNTKSNTSNRTVNLAGGEAFVQSPKLALVSLLLTSFVKDQYYRTAKEGLDDLVRLIDAVNDPLFVAKAAVYARTKFGMRSISHVVAGELARRVKGEQWTKNFYDKIVYRPDDMMEILAYYKSDGSKNEPNAMKKGFARAFARFDEYQLAKYKKEGAEISLIDVANIVHPTHSAAIEALIKGTLKTPETWEAKLSKAGQDAESDEDKDKLKADVWKQLIATKKIGYFALLRNLRNIIEQAPELVPQAMELLTDEALIKKSLVLPFRFLTAIEEIEKLNGQGVREVLGALNIAIDKSTSNVPEFAGDTLVVMDESGSMSGQPQEIGALFSAVLLKANKNADFMMFQNDARYLTYNSQDSTLTIANSIKGKARGGGTSFHSIFQEANRKYDRFIILSDEQGWVNGGQPGSSVADYKNRTGANPRIYSFDLQGYGSMQFPEENVFAIAGFSEKIFDVMKLLEEDRQALIHEIDKIEL